ncbi:MAG: ribulose-phosphate 3-epimerase [Planctomycetota bacterium]|nr:MAG: ribulose-phosphate 3-epimerase [Planctomycetota bacterium]REK23760.1 MAG: ribulose-phosphate 3-epimerase [Planctomycetota bacterium]REK47613.1 MAG: ribulose-phosphate 3-epimerase [Planctomycetota bacterium]
MPEHDALAALRGTSAILPSMLMCDFGHLAREVERLEAAGTVGLHLDVMDGHFVPNTSYGLVLVETFRRLTKLPLDVHLMISNPAEYVERYVEAGADVVSVHVEADSKPVTTLEKIRSAGAAAGLAINPPTSVDVVEPLLDACDVVVVMGVMPGFGGQTFDPVALEKLRQLRDLGGEELILEVDGGVNQDTIAECAAAGANWYVTGSAIFRSDDYGSSLAALSALVENK